MKTAVYCRVSTDDKGQDPLNQLMQMPAHELEFVDFASGKTGDRDQFQAMLRAAENHEFDELVVWSLDRLTREGTLSTLLYLDKFAKLGITIRALHDDTSNELLVLIKSWIAKEERLRISLRTKAGMQRAKQSGTRSGRAIGRPRAGLESQCRELRASGLSLKRIGMTLNVSPAYVCKSLQAAV